MKTIFKLINRYVASAAGIALMILALNLVLLIALLAISNTGRVSSLTIAEIADSLTKQNEEYQLAPGYEQELDKQFAWAMLLNPSGDVIWGRNLPDDLPRQYSLARVASFSRWYLQDYPVLVWEHADGLLVLAYPRESLWKHQIQFPVQMIDSLPVWFVVAIILNALLAVGLAVLSGVRMFKSLQVLAGGIEDLSVKKPVELPTGGLLGDLAEKLNRTSAELVRQDGALEKRDTARAFWIRGVSHDIRTPLSMVMGYASDLEENPALPAAEREQATIIRRQSERIKSLVNDLNLASRLEYDMQPLRMEDIHLVELIRETVANFINNGLEPPFEIKLFVDTESNSAVIPCDSQLLQRALINLIQNSIQHNPGGCTVRVAIASSFTHCSISVADDGAGYPQRVLDQGNQPSNPDDNERLGLGLTIVRQIITAHGGAVVFRNQHGSGGIAEIMLPLSKPAEKS